MENVKSNFANFFQKVFPDFVEKIWDIESGGGGGNHGTNSKGGDYVSSHDNTTQEVARISGKNDFTIYHRFVWSGLFRGITAVMRVLEEFNNGKISKYSLLLAAIPRNRIDPNILF